MEYGGSGERVKRRRFNTTSGHSVVRLRRRKTTCLNLVSTCYSRRHRRRCWTSCFCDKCDGSLSFWLNTCKSLAKPSSLMSRLNSLTANHRTLMFRSADFCDLHVTLNILEFLQRAPCSMRNLEARYSTCLITKRACRRSSFSPWSRWIINIAKERFETNKRSPKLISTWGYYTRHDSWNSRRLSSRGIRPTSWASESIFPHTFDYTSSHYLSLLHHLRVLHDMYRPTTDGGAIQEEATATAINSRSRSDQIGQVAVDGTQWLAARPLLTFLIPFCI